MNERIEAKLPARRKAIIVRKAGATWLWVLARDAARRLRRHARYWNRVLSDTECGALLDALRTPEVIVMIQQPAPPPECNRRPLKRWQKLPDFGDQSVYEEIDDSRVPAWLVTARKELESQSRVRDTISGRVQWAKSRGAVGAAQPQNKPQPPVRWWSALWQFLLRPVW